MTTTETFEHDVDPAAVEEFAGRAVDILNGAMLALSTSIGHRTGLFDTMAGLAPATSAEIASTAGLQERYVREWLGTMVVGGVVRYDPGTQAYHLPTEHAAVLTRAAGADNLASLTQFVALLGSVEEDIVRCFHDGGGVSYERFPTFHRVMGELTKDTIDATLFDGVLPLVPGLTERLEQGIDVADIGCGSGYAVNVLARAFPASRFVGYDFSEEAIAAARAQAAEWRLSNARFEVRDVTALGEREAFDFVTTFDAIHDQAAPATVLHSIADSLRPDGTYLCVDVAASSHLEENVGHPLGPTIYTISTMHCMTVSLALDGAGLGAAWGEHRARGMLAAAGFAHVTTEHVDGDIFNVYYVARKH